MLQNNLALGTQIELATNTNQDTTGTVEIDFSLIALLPNGRVEARNLWKFLESKQEFANWIKNIVQEYDFEANVEVFDKLIKNPLGGRPTQDYELTVDCAKEICMISKSDKGKQARKYFIAMEQKARNTELPKPMTQAEILLAQAQFMVETERTLKKQEQALTEVKSELAQFKLTQSQAMEELTAIDTTTPVELKDKSTRSKISELVRSYCVSANVPFRDCWNKLYSEFYYIYHTDLKIRAKNKGLKPMDIAEQLGMLEQLWSVAVAVCTKNNKDN